MTLPVSRERLLVALQDIEDPELGFSIVALGLVYTLSFDAASGCVGVTMTLTSPLCPLQEHFRSAVVQRLSVIPEVVDVHVSFLFDPPWSVARASDEVQAELLLRGVRPL